METGSSSPAPVVQQKPTLFTKLNSCLSKMKNLVVDFAKRMKKIGQDDPRRIAHSFKVALAITLVSTIYYIRPLYDGLGSAGIWAILTVVVVFEYTVGATLSKGINRGIATFLAGALGVGAEYLASQFGEKPEPFILGFLVFLLVTAATFSRFIPSIKKRYDYGVLIFILTFSLVSVSGYRVNDIIELGHQRLSTIILGGATCIIISLCVLPVWAGEDLHNHIVLNLEKLASFLEGFGREYYQLSVDGDGDDNNKEDKSFLAAYKSVLNSKATEESLANFAWWEPAHGKFLFRHPWKHYLKIGVLARQCAYHIDALNGYIDGKTQPSSEFQKILQEPCTKMSSESGIALKELALSIKSMSFPSTSSLHIQNCKDAVEELNTTLQASVIGKWDVLEMVPVMTVTSILIDIINCVEKMSEAIEELSNLARFKKPIGTPVENDQKPSFLRRGSVKPVDGDEDKNFAVINVREMASEPPENPELKIEESKK